MKEQIIKANGDDFIVHFKDEGDPDYKMRWSGTATQILKYSDKTWNYLSNNSSDGVDDFKDARVWFKWSYCWRGVWEGRIYFQDEEYWSEEMETIAQLWKQIEFILKERIKSDNPRYGHFDT